MKEKEREENNIFDAPVTVGLVGHCPIEKLPELKEFFQHLEGFDVIFFRTSSGRLWITEDDQTAGAHYD